VGNTKNPTPLEQKKRTNKTQQTKSLIVNSYANIFFYIQITKNCMKFSKKIMHFNIELTHKILQNLLHNDG
jgi:hypothetical protein